MSLGQLASARAIIDLGAASPLRVRMWLSEATKASRSSVSIAKEFGYRNLDVLATKLTPDKGSETLFILGGGTSVNSLTPENFETIGQGVSIGINAWAIHDFVPDAYALETAANSNPDDADTSYITKRLTRSEVLHREPRFLFLRPTLPATPRNLVQVPPGLQSVSFMYGRANLITRRTRNIVVDSARLLDAYVDGNVPRNVLPDNGATVFRLLYFGILQGFRSIVLVGIDLDHRGYFWQAPEFGGDRAHLARVFDRPIGVPHDTLSPETRPFPTDVAIVQIAAMARLQRGIQVFAGNQRGSMGGSLPVFAWRNHQ